ncbi:MAG TPA: hypothetical protein VKT78_17925 [Fimbriimonadaceae bacterium]|nr:hypothetical protein [Fimbriimonadaceae bacterium]
MTIGDVLAWVGGIGALCGSAWALYVAVALLFVRRSNQAADAITESPWKHGLIGFAVALVATPVCVALIPNPIPGARLLGMMVLLTVMALAAVGGAGVALIAAQRIRALDPGVTPFGALSRGAALVVVPCLTPLLGWFLLAPALFFVGLGAGVRTLRAPEAATNGFLP